jgi:peroxiredoxin
MYIYTYIYSGMGMSITWHTERGFGERSWRYSVVINDNIVEKIFIENGIPVQVI